MLKLELIKSLTHLTSFKTPNHITIMSVYVVRSQVLTEMLKLSRVKKMQNCELPFATMSIFSGK